MKRVLRASLAVAKWYFILVGVLVTVMVGRQIYLSKTVTTSGAFKAQLNLTMPPANFSNQGEKK